MVLWGGLALVLVVVVGLVAWGARGMADRVHEPGTTHLDRPVRGRRGLNRPPTG